MLKKTFIKKLARRVLVFGFVFALTGAFMGNHLVGFAESDAYLTEPSFFDSMKVESKDGDVIAKTSSTYSEFANIIRRNNANNGDNIDDSFILDSHMSQTGFVYLPTIPLSEELQRFTYDRCQEVDIEYELVLALMWRESRFQTGAIGYNTNGTRDSGVMQINDVNKKWLKNELGITDLMDPKQNITAGTAMLAKLFSKYNTVEKALMAYHYGESGMLKKIAQGETTNKQVTIALNKRDSYKQLIQKA